MAPVNPGSQSRSDLIGKMGPGAGGAANRIFSVNDPFAALGINEGYGSIAAGFLDNDSAGTPVRGGPRVYAEEYSNAPSVNGVGGKSLAERPAGAAPSAPRKEYGYRSGRSRSPVAAQSVVTVYPSAYQTPDPNDWGSDAVSSPSNTGHGDTSVSAFGTHNGISFYDFRSCKWWGFQFGGQAQSIILKVDWSESGFAYGSGDNDFRLEFSLDGGANWTVAFDHYYIKSSNSGTFQISLSPSQNVSQILVRDHVGAIGDEDNQGAYLTASISNIRLEIETDTTPPVISNVTSGGINLYSATISWNTNENSDSQVDYGTTAAYGQSTILNPSGVTSHSQGLFGLTPGTEYHYRVKSRDANGNLAVSTDYTFTTAPLVIYNVAAGDIAASCVTITWNTNVSTNSQVEYRTNIGSWQTAPLNPLLVTAHSQVLTGLTAGTVYYYRVRSRDQAGNLVVSGDYTFTTGTLVVSNVNVVNITTSSATITWNTNEPTTTQVQYGLTPAYGGFEPLTPSAPLATEHSVVLTGLTPGTVYYFRTYSIDEAGNHAYCSGLTFTTAQSVPLDGLASLSYNGANNRITTAGFEYDPAGNQTRAVINASGTQQQYRYDCAGRLAQVLDGSGNVLATYSYGAGNQRLMSVEGGVTKYFAWAGGKIIAEYEAWGTNALIWKTSYVFLGGQLLATTSGAGGTEIRFYHPDRLGTRLVTDAAGTVVSEQLSMPFGTMLPFTPVYGGENSYQHPTLGNPSKKRFTTYDRSDATGLDYAVNRFYSPQQGRFTQVDPIGMGASELANPQSLNLYAYVENDPINSTDPLGLDGMTWSFLGPFPTGGKSGGGGGGGLRIGPFNLSFSFGFGGKMPPIIPGTHCCRDDLRPPEVGVAIIKWLFGDYVDDPGDASNTISQALRGPSALLINPGKAGAQVEVGIADTNLLTEIMLGVENGLRPQDFGVPSGAQLVVTDTIIDEVASKTGVSRDSLVKSVNRLNIRIQNPAADKLAAASKEAGNLFSGTLPKDLRKAGNTLTDLKIIAEAKALGIGLFSNDAGVFHSTAKGGGTLAKRLGVAFQKTIVSPRAPDFKGRLIRAIANILK
jgi:RHS repeat-associated protein